MNGRSTEKNAELDVIDRDIITALQRDARMNYKDLAARVSLSANAVADRVRRLIKTGVIIGFRTETSTAATGLTLSAYVDVKLRADVSAERFEEAVVRIPGVLQLTLTTGSFDYSIRVACKDQLDLVRLIEALRAAIPVTETYSRVILRERTLPELTVFY